MCIRQKHRGTIHSLQHVLLQLAPRYYTARSPIRFFFPHFTNLSPISDIRKRRPERNRKQFSFYIFFLYMHVSFAQQGLWSIPYLTIVRSKTSGEIVRPVPSLSPNRRVIHCRNSESPIGWIDRGRTIDEPANSARSYSRFAGNRG